MSGNLDITGYAIVSDDDKIAGADGLTPASLRNEKDWELYQRAQKQAALVVFARRSFPRTGFGTPTIAPRSMPSPTIEPPPAAAIASAITHAPRLSP